MGMNNYYIVTVEKNGIQLIQPTKQYNYKVNYRTRDAYLVL